VRGYFEEKFPGSSIRDSYDAGRLAQVFRIEADDVGGVRDAVVSTEFLEEYPPEKMGKALVGLRVAEHLRSAKGKEVLVTSWGVEERED
jgi:F0F1-type ATP synthase beta subunit